MKRLIHIGILALVALLAVSCYEEQPIVARLTVQLRLDDAPVEIDVTKLDVILQNKAADFSYTGHADASGQLAFEVQPGRYDVSVSFWDEPTRTAVNGASEEFLLTATSLVDGQGVEREPTLEVRLNVAVPNPLIIREFYYHGSKTFEGAVYSKDTYIELYNNAGYGGQTIWLDSLCIAAIYPYNSTTGNNAWAGRDTIAIAQMYWMFPGDGHTYPLAPGESAVVACIAAVDHTTRSRSGLQLNRAHFGCWSETLPRHEIAAGVVPMVLNMTGQGTQWALSIHSPAIVVFKPEMGVAAYQSQGDIWERFEPGKTSGTKYWHIAKNWILDGVECVDSPASATKRLPVSVDAGYTWIRAEHYSGLCITRHRVPGLTVGGIDVFEDSNFSNNDFYTDVLPKPRLRP